MKKENSEKLNIKINQSFLRGRMELVAREVVPYQWEILNDNLPDVEPSHAIENFRIAAGDSQGEFYGMFFQDSDVAKWIEAASYSLLLEKNTELESQIDQLIEVIGRAQQSDGYLNTYYTVAKPEKRWKEISFGHELYCAGHFIEAAVAYYNATGKRSLLQIICRYVDYIDSVFGPAEGQIQDYPGHEEIELALIKLYHVTEEKRYLDLCRFFIDQRGTHFDFFKAGEDLIKSKEDRKWFQLDYHQAHEPVRQQNEAVGHSVRAVYLYTAMADVYLETGDSQLLKALDSLWKNVINQRMYITGAIGSQSHAERFTFDYDLPNDRIYGETCAAIGFAFWAHRMLLIEPDNLYADAFERVLYNSVLSGISWDGKNYFYTNPLEVHPESVEKRHDLKHIKAQRIPWYGCACCPPNIARFLLSLADYICTVHNEALFFHQYVQSDISCVVNGETLRVSQKTDYPWKGSIEFQIETDCEKPHELAFRIPQWCKDFSFRINGQAVEHKLHKGYLRIKRNWQKADKIELDLKMEASVVKAHPKIRWNLGKAALQYGPVIYCVEEVDNGGDLTQIFLSQSSEIKACFDSDFFGGMVVLNTIGLRVNEDAWGDSLYQEKDLAFIETKVKAVPYFIWGNRGKGEMLVWMNQR